MCAWMARLMRNEPRRWTPMTESQSCSVILKMRLSRVMPALLTRIVGAPRASATWATAAATWSASATSTPTPIAWPPASVMAPTVSAQLAASRSSTPTRCPSAASRLAVAAPMPRADPVTMAVRGVVGAGTATPATGEDAYRIRHGMRGAGLAPRVYEAACGAGVRSAGQAGPLRLDPEHALLCRRGDQTAVRREHPAEREAAAALGRRRRLRVEDPLVGPRRTVEPHRVVEAGGSQPLVGPGDPVPADHR